MLRVMYVKDGKPEQFTPEEGSAFDGSDYLFQGCVISVLAKNIVDRVSGSQLARNCGMLVRLNMECLMPVVSCM